MNNITTIQIPITLSERIATLRRKRAAAMKMTKLSKSAYLELLIAEEEQRIALQEKKQNND